MSHGQVTHVYASRPQQHEGVAQTHQLVVECTGARQRWQAGVHDTRAPQGTAEPDEHNARARRTVSGPATDAVPETESRRSCPGPGTPNPNAHSANAAPEPWRSRGVARHEASVLRAASACARALGPVCPRETGAGSRAEIERTCDVLDLRGGSKSAASEIQSRWASEGAVHHLIAISSIICKGGT